MIKFISNELNLVTVLSSEPYARPCRGSASSPATPRVGRYRSSPVALARRPYPLSRSRVRFPLPFSSIAQQGAEQPSLAAVRRYGHPSPPCLDSSRPKPLHLALHLLRSILCSIEPSVAGIEAADRGRHCCRPSFALSVDLQSPVILRPIQGRSELPRTLLHLPNPFSPWFRRHGRREHAAPPRPPEHRRCARREPPPRWLPQRRRAPQGWQASLAAGLPCPPPTGLAVD